MNVNRINPYSEKTIPNVTPRKKTSKIETIILNNLPSEEHSPFVNFNARNIEKKVVLSSKTQAFISEIQKQQELSTNNNLFDILCNYAYKNAEALDTELKAIEIKSHLSQSILITYFHILTWSPCCYYENVNKISEIKKHHFFLTPKGFTKDNLKKFFGSIEFNPLEKGLKKHLALHLISLFVNSKQNKMPWQAWEKSSQISKLIDALRETCEVIQELIWSPDFCYLSEAPANAFIENFTGNSGVESSFLTLKMIVMAVKIQEDMIPFNCSNEFVNFCNNFDAEYQNEKPNPENLFNDILNLYSLSTGWYTASKQDFELASRRKLTHSEFALGCKMDVKEYDSQDKFIARVEFIHISFLIHTNALKKGFEELNKKMNIGVHVNCDNYIYTKSLCDFLLKQKKEKQFNQNNLKSPTLKKHYQLIDCFLKSNAILDICKMMPKLNKETFEYLHLVPFFFLIKDQCEKFREFSTELKKCKVEAENLLQELSLKEYFRFTKEYDVFKSHFYILLIFLSALSKIEIEYLKLHILEEKGVSATESRMPVGTYIEAIENLEEIVEFFVSDQFFQTIYERKILEEQEAKAIINVSQEVVIDSLSECEINPIQSNEQPSEALPQNESVKKKQISPPSPPPSLPICLKEMGQTKLRKKRRLVLKVILRVKTTLLFQEELK